MSLLGKILLFVNLLVAGALVYLSAQGWAKRRELNNILLRYDLTVKGLPTDGELPADADDPVPLAADPEGLRPVDAVDRAFLDKYFQAAQGGGAYGGETVGSLAAEVKRVKGKIEGTVLGQNAAGRIALLAGRFDAQRRFTPGLLVALADTYEERQAIRQAAAAPAARQQQVADDLVARLNAKWDAVSAAPAPGAAPAGDLEAPRGFPPHTRSDDERRVRMAQLLFPLDPSKEWQTRVAHVAGLKTYLVALTGRTTALQQMSSRVEREMDAADDNYLQQYTNLRRVAQGREGQLSQQLKAAAVLRDQKAQDDAHVSTRTTQLNALKADLAQVQGQVADALKAQAEVEAALFKAQSEVAELLRGNAQREGRLAAEQKKRFPQPSEGK